MVGTYAEFATAHRAQHPSAFNRWSAVVGNLSNVPTAMALLLRRPRLAGLLFGAGTTALVLGHVVDGSLTRTVRDTVRHPVWSVRADFSLALDTLSGALRSGRRRRTG